MSLNSLINYGSDSENEETVEITVDRHDSCAINSSTTQILSPSNVTTIIDVGTGCTVFDVAYVDEPVTLLPGLPAFIATRTDEAVSVISNIQKFLNSGLDVTTELRKIKQFSNPCILTKVVTQLGIDEIGSNYPVSVFDPHGYSEGDFEDQIKRRYATYVAPAVTLSTTHLGAKLLSNSSTGETSVPSSTMAASVDVTGTAAPKKRSRWSSEIA